jgi:hypothetical protein
MQKITRVPVNRLLMLGVLFLGIDARAQVGVNYQETNLQATQEKEQHLLQNRSRDIEQSENESQKTFNLIDQQQEAIKLLAKKKGWIENVQGWWSGTNKAHLALKSATVGGTAVALVQVYNRIMKSPLSTNAKKQNGDQNLEDMNSDGTKRWYAWFRSPFRTVAFGEEKLPVLFSPLLECARSKNASFDKLQIAEQLNKFKDFLRSRFSKATHQSIVGDFLEYDDYDEKTSQSQRREPMRLKNADAVNRTFNRMNSRPEQIPTTFALQQVEARLIAWLEKYLAEWLNQYTPLNIHE